MTPRNSRRDPTNLKNRLLCSVRIKSLKSPHLVVDCISRQTRQSSNLSSKESLPPTLKMAPLNNLLRKTCQWCQKSQCNKVQRTQFHKAIQGR